MKNTILTLFVTSFFSITLYGQEEPMGESVPENIMQCLDEFGKDSSIVLNTCESAYLDHRFQKRRGSFSFKDKAVFFRSGNYGHIRSDKKTYFGRLKQALNTGRIPSSAEQLIIFDEGKREKTGCDAVIVSWSKVSVRSKDLVKKLKKQ